MDSAVVSRGARGYGTSHPIKGRKPIMGLGMSDVQREILASDYDEADEEAEKPDPDKVKVSRAFQVDENKIRRLIKEVLYEKGLFKNIR
jgi:hypothetical protein